MMQRKKILEKILHFMAKNVLAKYHPFVIGVTGSVGKSSTKEAIELVVSKIFSVRKAEGNYNNEIGIALTILGEKSGGTSLLAWLLIVLRWCFLMLFRRQYPEALVLEMGIDRPKDMDYFLSFIPVDIGVVTQISSSHLEFFGTLGNIAKEKGKMIQSLPESGFAILNFDDKYVIRMQEKTKAKVLTYGFGEGAMFHIDNLLFQRDVKRIEGLSFKLNYAGKTIPMRLPRVVAKHHIGAVLGATAVGTALKMNLVEIAEALENFEPLPGRMRLLSGKNMMTLLDDTYNASPSSTLSALETVKDLMAPRKVFIFGDMLELGAESRELHTALGEYIIASGIQIVVLVGVYAHFLYEELLTLGFPGRQLHWFPDVSMTEERIDEIVREEDLILIKGSRGMRMEKITERLLGDKENTSDVLCCQSPSWKERPFREPEEWQAFKNDEK
ncbi:MAG: UDP-N-acetylmuramoyl-tripeptide--D-alanyl-D-alanine ligase [Candidatus Moranbacteria bacterium]|nr:UDP-N-acetylmuramoyl-tripeptide--D-alanyl-D-alanine ligase [Candidatus Moranbacteria bacterium]OIQ01984.1 MAG: hypothetical protein AUK58_03725 [Candidatus Moranbacteria bacterium CG2_30_41_165]